MTKHTISVKADDSLRQRLTKHASLQFRSKSSIIKQALDEHLPEYGEVE